MQEGWEEIFLPNENKCCANILSFLPIWIDDDRQTVAAKIIRKPVQTCCFSFPDNWLEINKEANLIMGQ